MVGPDSTERVPPNGPSAPHLLIVAADGTWTSRPLSSDAHLTIGRGIEVDIRVDERAVSRKHARLEPAGASNFRLVDLDSTNGTLVGSRLVRSGGVTVRPGEPIKIGSTFLAVYPPSPANEDPPPLVPGPAMARVHAWVRKTAPTLDSVLLLGETGVGKGVIAQHIHDLSTRRGELMQLNCAGLDAMRLESELFGHERGAFTGAVHTKRGLLEEAAGGTVFLDEIGEMPVDVQAKLLVAIDQRIAWRLGANKPMQIDVRFICATHRDLKAEIARGRFREDFYYRIDQLSIHIPPLRERRDELDGLISHFASERAAALKRDQVPAFDDEARAALHRYDWPGNIRQLRRVVERAVLHAEDGVVTSRILVDAELPVDVRPPSDGFREDAERERVIAALDACGGNQTRAASMLGMSRNTLIARMEKYGLKRPRSKANPSTDRA